MASHRTALGSVLTFPDGVEIEDISFSPFGGGNMIRGAFAEYGFPTVFDDAGFERDEAIELALRSGGAPIAVEPVEMDVPVEAGTDAVLLVERDGALSWRYPEGRAESSGVRGAATLNFRIDPSPGPIEGGDVRGWIHDIIADWLGSVVRVYVLRFAAEKAVEHVTPFLERDVTEGIVNVDGLDPARWSRGEMAQAVKPPGSILLLVHGTFSSTAGSFGALCGEDGASRGLLAALLAKYDRVIGFDHRTLTEDPLANAEKLATALDAMGLPDDVQMDAIAFSRGGLLLRMLNEHVLPRRRPSLSVRRAVFVGCTNGGTNLAQPQNWKRMLDIYTNLVLAGTRAAGYIPGLGTGAAIASETIKNISAFVKEVARFAVDESRVPGLAAMRPGSEQIALLNDSPPSELAPYSTRYFWTGIAFDANRSVAPHLAAGMRDYLAYHVADQLFEGANDLVVDCDKMHEFGRHATIVDPRSAALSADYRTYHTTYFSSAQLCGMLGDWLLDTPGLYEVVRAQVQVIDADSWRDEVLQQLGSDDLAPIVVADRALQSVRYHVFQTSELRTALLATPPAATLGESLGRMSLPTTLLRASDEHPKVQMFDQSWTISNQPAPKISRSADAVGTTAGDGQRLQVERQVVVVHGEVVGVVPDADWTSELDAQDRMTVRSMVPDASMSAPTSSFPFLAPPPADVRPAQSTEEAEAPGMDGDAASSPSADGGGEMTPSPVVECQFDAEMPSRPSLGQTIPVILTISLEQHDVEDNPTSRTVSAPVKQAERILVRARAMRNCEIEGEREKFAMPPLPSAPEVVEFQMRGRAEGEAEIWISAIQSQRTLVTIPLNPVFVKETGKLSVQARVSLDDDEGALIDLRIRDTTANNESEVQLEYELSSDDLTLFLENKSHKLDGMKRLSFIEGIYADIEKFWRAAARAGNGQGQALASFMSEFHNELMDKGASLCDQLIPIDIRRALWDAHIQNRVGAIRVLTKEPSIPWEMLYLRDPSRKVPQSKGAFLAELGLLRWNTALGYPPARVEIDCDLAFYLIPDYPAPYTLQGTSIDRSMMEKLFGAKPLAATTARMRRLFGEEEFDLFHAGCHGEARIGRPWESGLLLDVNAGIGGNTYLRSSLVEGHLSNGRRPVVFLNACQVGMPSAGLVGAAGLGQTFLEFCKASILVAPMWSVQDGTASLFARTFYEKMVQGVTLVQAMRHARRVAKQAGDPTWLAYSVWGHPLARVELKKRVVEEVSGAVK
ncbi:DUF7379 domain-containing protein [Paraburkholderia atlantica]|uniref:DUF7379 domain-containing protein n=1 Tax=Paraburkholderia atlantica TaxID=2654982 RepID=UPI003D217A58